MPTEIWGMVCDNVVGEECIGLLASINKEPAWFDPLDLPFGSNVKTLLHISRTTRVNTLRILKHLFGPGDVSDV